MNNRLPNLLFTISSIFFAFLSFMPQSNAQFVPTINSPLYVSTSCDTTIISEQGATFSSTDPNLVLVNFQPDATLSNYVSNTPIAPGNSVNLFYVASYENGQTDTFSYIVNVLDSSNPVLQNVPADITLTCDLPLPTAATVSATDDCDNSVDLVLEETTINTNCGSDYQLQRVWTATDDSGNTTVETQLITVIDTVKPEYTALPNVTIDCQLNSLIYTGEINTANVTDCANDTDISIMYIDTETAGSCANEKTIARQWVISDGCGNDSITTQIITLIDTIAPTFTPTSGDTIVSCETALGIANLGKPINIQDNCDNNPSIYNTDIILSNICANNSMFERRWYIEDACGNIDSTSLMITIVDTIAPVINTSAQNQEISCTSNLDIDDVFNTWITNNGGATATDNCSADVFWSAYNTGTSVLANLSAASCPSNEIGVYRQQTVDFIAEDACGNTDTTTATFKVIDNEAPILSLCPVDTTIFSDVNTCTADYTLVPPVISEDCGSNLGSENHSAIKLIFGLPGVPEDTPLETLSFDFGVSPHPTVATDSATFEIEIFNVDSEDETEYFEIVGENGTVVGRTNNSDMQCGNSYTLLKFSPEQINAWAYDGTISLQLRPHIPPGLAGRFSVNPICSGVTYTTTELFYTTSLPNSLKYEYAINGGDRITQTDIITYTETLETGSNEIEYFVTDCAGNETSCSFTVMVQDTIPPTMTCPSDLTVDLPMDSCQYNYTLAFPQDIADNCGIGSMTTVNFPENAADALLTFDEDPNLNDFLANDKVFNITNAGSNVISTVTVTVNLRADDVGTGAFYTIQDENNNPLGVISGLGCDTTSQLTITVLAQDYNNWASDGIVTFSAISNKNIPIPPGGPSDGINPCDANAVINNGDNDGISSMSLTISYQNVTPSYYAEGATIIPYAQMQPPTYLAMENLNAGETNIFYVIEDIYGNADTCSHVVNVQDTQTPVALCGPSFVTINPSGAVVDTIYPGEINSGSYDNCSIDTMFVTPNVVTCNSDTLNVTLTVIDAAGNEATCQTFIGVTSTTPEPTYTVDCEEKKLQLFANPPNMTGNVTYTYIWTGPTGSVISFAQNPVIQEINDTYAGFYTVKITGITGCTAEGVVEVLQSNLPPVTPDFFIVDNTVCSNENIVLTASSPPGSAQVKYIWYLEDNGTNVALDTTTTPFYTFPAPATDGNYCYHVVASRQNCLSQPSITNCVQVTQSPTTMFAEDNITICEGEDVTLEAVLPVPGPGVTYEFISPMNSQNSPNYQFFIENPPANDGDIYLLTAYKNGCQSNTATATVFVNPVPDQPEITSNSPICIGDTLTLLTNVQGAATYIWTGPNFSEFITNVPTFQIPNALNSHQGNWRVRVVTDQNCTTINSLFENVTITPKPIINASVANNFTCANEQIQLSVNTLEGASYSWSGPNGYTANTANAMANPVVGTYTVTVTNQNGCAATDSVIATLQDAPSIIGVAASDNDCPSGPEDVMLKALLSDNSQNYDFLWTGTDFMSTDSCAVIENATIDENGSYQVIITAENGCSDTSAVQVTMGQIIETPTTPLSVTGSTLCSGDVLTLTSSATYPSTDVTWYWITPTGTTSTSIPTLVIDELTTENTGVHQVYTKVGNCFSDTSGVLLLTVNPTPVTTVECLNCPVCEGDDILLSASCDIEGATFEWTSNTGFNSSLCAPTISNANNDIHEGTYNVRVRVNNCWSESVSVYVPINERPNNPQAAQNGPYCVGTEMITLNVTPSTATPGATYIWYQIDPDGQAIEVGSTISTTFQVPNSSTYTDGQYKFFVQATMNGCESLPSAEVTAHVSTIPNNQANAGDDIVACVNQPINLSADAPTIGTGLWTQFNSNPDGAEITNPDENNTSVTGLTPGDNGNTYNFVWSLSNGACLNYSIDTTVVTVNVVELAQAGNDLVVCSASEATLEAIQPSFGIGIWTQPSTQQQLGVSIIEPNNPNSLVTGLVPGNTYFFTWTIPDNGCGGDSDVVQVIVSNETANAGQDFDSCGDGCTTLNASTPGIGGGEWFSPNGNITFTDKTNPTTDVCGLEQGENIFIWIINEGNCGMDGLDTMRVNYRFAPTANEDLYTVGFAGTEQLNIVENDMTADNFFINIIQAPAHGKLEEVSTGVYNFTADINYVGSDFAIYEICALGCDCSQSFIRFAIGGDAQCETPSIITPNNDGINDAFVIPCLAQPDKYPDNKVSIFNQWGDEVFSATPYKNNWEGTYNGQELPVGTYFFIIDFGNNEKPKTGFLIINR